jgi:hypothetical protein
MAPLILVKGLGLGFVSARTILVEESLPLNFYSKGHDPERADFHDMQDSTNLLLSVFSMHIRGVKSSIYALPDQLNPLIS